MSTREMLDETFRMRQKAEKLLSGLLEAQAEAEKQIAGQKKLDPIKVVTGRSAMENAIASTRRMIVALDQALEIATTAAAEEAGLDVLDKKATGGDVVVRPHSPRHAT